MKDIALMNRDTTFSTPLGVIADFYLLQPITYVNQVEYASETIDQQSSTEDDFEEFTLFE